MGYKIVHIQEAPPSQVFTNAETCNSHHTLRLPNKDQPITCTFLASKTGKEVVFLYVRSKLPHNGITS